MGGTGLEPLFRETGAEGEVDGTDLRGRREHLHGRLLREEPSVGVRTQNNHMVCHWPSVAPGRQI